jgi:hypothetical protein
MMNRKRLVLGLSIVLSLPVFLLLLILVFLDKQSSPQSSMSFDDLMAIEDMNETIRLSDLPFMTEGMDSNLMAIGLRNYSDGRVEFPVNWGVRIFINNGIQSGWTEIKNDMTYTTIQGVNPILSAKGSNLAQTIVNIIPVLPNPGQPVTIRVFVTGNVLSFISTPGKLVGAYVDIFVQS